MSDREILEGHLLDEALELTLGELARTCGTDADWLLALVEEGALEPQGGRQLQEWRFTGLCVSRVQRAQRLQQDLGLNLAGVALVLDMLDELDHLRRRLAAIEPDYDPHRR
jgi:chaperone modulatory protein CbpM